MLEKKKRSFLSLLLVASGKAPATLQDLCVTQKQIKPIHRKKPHSWTKRPDATEMTHNTHNHRHQFLHPMVPCCCCV